jgi:alkanesulfonate monooxygenase
MRMRFHWRMLQGSETAGVPRGTQNFLAAMALPDLEAQADFCRRALRAGIDSLLLDFGFAKPDPMLLAAALGLAVDDIGFIVAFRSGLMSPVTFVQQLNTLSALIRGRLSLNIVAGDSPAELRGYGDFLAHDERYARTGEWLAVCHAFWRGERDIDFAGTYYHIDKGNLRTPFVSSQRPHPEIFIAGNSEAARRLALARGTCWMQLGDTPENVRQRAAGVLEHGGEIGLRMSVIARPTREEAVRAARELVKGLASAEAVRDTERRFVEQSDSVSMDSLYRRADEEWLSPTLWAGAVRTHGAPALALVGSPADIAAAILEYKRVGVSQFIFSGWPKAESMEFFGTHVLPLIRELEEADGRNPEAGNPVIGDPGGP